MEPPRPLELTLLNGARALLSAHARELPQRDDLCGAFCGALAMEAAGIGGLEGEPLDQDAFALAAGSIVSRTPDTGSLPRGEHGRRDYRIVPPMIDDAGVAGTTAGGVIRAIERLSGARLSAIPFSGPWTPQTLDGCYELAAAAAEPIALVANVATGQLWGGRPSPPELLDYLLDGVQEGPEPDWDVGHFVCVVGRICGPAGSLYCVADTYPSLGNGGVHLQPRERLAAALERRGMAPGGMIVVAATGDAGVLRAGAAELGLLESAWDNGTVSGEECG